MPSKPCAACGTTFKATGPRHRFCSSACAETQAEARRAKFIANGRRRGLASAAKRKAAA